MHAWPSTIREVQSEIWLYWTFREGWQWKMGSSWRAPILLLPTRNIKLHLTIIHEGHLGLGKCKLRAKDTVYWPGLNGQLEKLMFNCELCLKYSHSKYKQKPSTSLGQEIPVHPWTKLATDIFHFESTCYLLIVDYTSRFPVVCKLSLMTGQHIANQCKLIFSQYGWPETLISDNGPCYTTQALTSVMKSYDCESYYQLSSITHSQMVLLRSMSSLWKACSTKLKKKAKIFTCVSYDLLQYSLTGSLWSPMQIPQGRNAQIWLAHVKCC